MNGRAVWYGHFYWFCLFLIVLLLKSVMLKYSLDVVVIYFRSLHDLGRFCLLILQKVVFLHVFVTCVRVCFDFKD